MAYWQMAGAERSAPAIRRLLVAAGARRVGRGCPRCVPLADRTTRFADRAIATAIACAYGSPRDIALPGTGDPALAGSDLA